MGRLPYFLLLGYFTLARGRAQMKDQIRTPTTPINRSQVRTAHQPLGARGTLVVNECSGSRIRWACSRIRLDERLFGRAHRPL